jgi:hypothetical protein
MMRMRSGQLGRAVKLVGVPHQSLTVLPTLLISTLFAHLLVSVSETSSSQKGSPFLMLSSSHTSQSLALSW